MPKWLGLRIRYAGWFALILTLVGTALATGALRPLDDALAESRFRAVTHEATGSMALVEIDSRSLQAADAWPWDRRRYATAIDNLVAAGATIVAFDVDFSARSNAEADAALAEAISRHPGQVALATFVQGSHGEGAGVEASRNTPLPELSRHALLASVNVPVDSDGKVRGYDLSGPAGRPAISTLLAGRADPLGSFEIDFGIDRRSLTRLSFEDVLTGRFDRSQVAGRVILVGATAVELGDEFATPVGLVPGVVIHGLAYESLVTGRALKTLTPLALLALCGLTGLALLPQPRGGPALSRLMIRHVGVALGIAALPFVLQALAPVSLHLAPLVLTQALFAVWGTRVELQRRARAIVEEREAGLVHLSLHQPDTGLPNRRALLSDIETAWSADAARSVSVVVVEVDRHAEMRGVAGYDVANGLMIALAGRMSRLSGVRTAQLSSAALAFAVQGLNEESLTSLLDRVMAAEGNFDIEGQSIDAYLKVGAATASGARTAPDLLIERATAALNAARGVEGRVVVYDEETFASPANNLALMTEMRRALVSGEIALHYQPKLATNDGRIRSVEALCRWRHPIRGFVSPDEFITIAEETGQIRDLTEWAVERAIQDQARLRSWGHDLTFAVNISARLLTDPTFMTRTLELVAGARADLCFEITETAVIRQPALATEAVAAFRAAGIRISIDDYGSGLSSLSYLKMLRADELKIDKSLIADLLASQRDRLIIRSTVDLAHGLGMSVVAEGVETDEAAACLKLLGCDVLQGYWLSKALPLLQLAEFVGGVADGTAGLARRRETTIVPISGPSGTPLDDAGSGRLPELERTA